MLHFTLGGVGENGYGEFKSSFVKNPVFRLYIPLSIVFRMCIGLYSSLQLEYEEGTLLVLVFSLFFVVINLANLPFKSTLHNYRSSFIHLTEFLILFVANYYRSMKANTPASDKARMHTAALIEIACLCICVALSLAVGVYEVTVSVKKILERRKGNKVEQEDFMQISESKRPAKDLVN